MDTPAIVLVGSLSEGYRAVGPYENFEAAAEASEGIECWILTIEPPEKIDG